MPSWPLLTLECSSLGRSYIGVPTVLLYRPRARPAGNRKVETSHLVFYYNNSTRHWYARYSIPAVWLMLTVRELFEINFATQRCRHQQGKVLFLSS